MRVASAHQDPALALGSGYRHGIVLFLRLVEAGVFPAAPSRSQLLGISPVAVALPAPNERFRNNASINHDFNLYAPQPRQYQLRGTSITLGNLDPLRLSCVLRCGY